MILFGTLINALCIIIGSIIGLFFTKINDKFKETVMHGIGLVVILIGIQMALNTNLIIVVLISILSGALIGEYINLDKHLNNIGIQISYRFSNGENAANISQAFISATLLYVVGAMAILGALDSGLRGDHEILFTKAVLDGFTSIVLTTTLGIGVILSAIPVFLYQGIITLFSTQIENIIPTSILDGLINELTAVGGLLIVAIGLNLLNLTQIRIANLLPSIATVVITFIIYSMF